MCTSFRQGWMSQSIRVCPVTISQHHPTKFDEPERNPYFRASRSHPPSRTYSPPAYFRHTLLLFLNRPPSLSQRQPIPFPTKSQPSQNSQVPPRHGLNSHSTDAHTTCTYRTSSSAHPHSGSALGRTPPANPCSPYCCIVLREASVSELALSSTSFPLSLPIANPPSIKLQRAHSPAPCPPTHHTHNIPSTISPLPPSPSASTSSTSFLFISRLS